MVDSASKKRKQPYMECAPSFPIIVSYAIQFLDSVSASNASAAATGAICGVGFGGRGAIEVGERLVDLAGGVKFGDWLDDFADGVNDVADGDVKIGGWACVSLERRRFDVVVVLPGFENTGGPRTTLIFTAAGRLVEPRPRRRSMFGTRMNSAGRVALVEGFDAGALDILINEYCYRYRYQFQGYISAKEANE